MDVSKAINYKANKCKAFTTLYGILKGIDADKTLKNEEVLFLGSWLKEQKYLPRDGDVLDIEDLITDILDDGIITQDEMDDLRSLLRDVVDFNDCAVIGSDEAVNQLIGFMKGITCDNTLNDREISSLADAIASLGLGAENSVISIVTRKLEQILADGVVTDCERLELLNLLKRASGQEFMETGAAEGCALSIVTENLPFQSISGVTVCFTGTFSGQSRKDIQKIATLRGAIVSKSITQKLNLLVVGGEASRDWKFSSYGRKIQTVFELRDKGFEIHIIDEPTWTALVDG
ncbi:BRCT domain-containing protein [Shewanella corallii]|uniref:BRCT domain-containing protein n=1 Tax=Shewanella corallii TaxID=560080 RepID=A0ABT0N7W6_9GAMM|nr:BRCT domain-containing protein [Shewanella corallii]MCL2914547.1 BRCT domain-containing protein [Shewanella corallii]